MKATMQRIWDKTHDETIIRNAVAKGWITAEDFEQITGEPYKE